MSSARLATLRAAVVAAFMTGAGHAQAEDTFFPQVPLHALDTAGGVLHKGEASASRSFVLDTARSLSLLVAATEELDVGVVLPDGTRLSRDQAGARKAGWLVWQGGPRDQLGVLPGAGQGRNIRIELNAPASGKYVVEVKRKSTGAETPFLVTLLEDSDLQMGLWVATPRVLVGEPVIVAAVLLDGNAPVAGAKIVGRWVAGDGAGGDGELALQDDGKGADHAAGDGIYTGVVRALPRPGKVLLAVRASGTNSHKAAFDRQSGLILDVSAPTVTITGAGKPRWTRHPDGTPALDVPITMSGPAGQYQAALTVRAPNGRATTAHQRLRLTKAQQPVDLTLPLPDLARLAPSGPYSIESVTVEEVTKPGDLTLRARRQGLGPAPSPPTTRVRQQSAPLRGPVR